MTAEPDIQQVVNYLSAKAMDHEAKAAEARQEMQKHEEEAKTFRQLAEGIKQKFPVELPPGFRTPIKNTPALTFETLQKELAKRTGRVSHVAKRLGMAEFTVRDLINTPNSEFYIGGAGWIRRKGQPDPFRKNV